MDCPRKNKSTWPLRVCSHVELVFSKEGEVVAMAEEVVLKALVELRGRILCTQNIPVNHFFWWVGRLGSTVWCTTVWSLDRVENEESTAVRSTLNICNWDWLFYLMAEFSSIGVFTLSYWIYDKARVMNVWEYGTMNSLVEWLPSFYTRWNSFKRNLSFIIKLPEKKRNIHARLEPSQSRNQKIALIFDTFC